MGVIYSSGAWQLARMKDLNAAAENCDGTERHAEGGKQNKRKVIQIEISLFFPLTLLRHGSSFNESPEYFQHESLCAIHSHHSAVNMVNYMFSYLLKHKYRQQRQFASCISQQVAIQWATISSG
jgi:hypothetical protein